MYRHHLPQAWTRADADGGGTLDREEVLMVLREMGQLDSEIDMDATMLDLDADGSGDVDFGEFKPWWLAQHGIEAAGEVDFDAMWEELDGNQNGELDFEEFKVWFFKQHDHIKDRYMINLDGSGRDMDYGGWQVRGLRHRRRAMITSSLITAALPFGERVITDHWAAAAGSTSSTSTRTRRSGTTSSRAAWSCTATRSTRRGGSRTSRASSSAPSGASCRCAGLAQSLHVHFLSWHA